MPEIISTLEIAKQTGVKLKLKSKKLEIEVGTALRILNLKENSIGVIKSFIFLVILLSCDSSKSKRQKTDSSHTTCFLGMNFSDSSTVSNQFYSKSSLGSKT